MNYISKKENWRENMAEIIIKNKYLEIQLMFFTEIFFSFKFILIVKEN